MRASTVAILGLAACAQGFQLTPVSVHPATRTTGVSLAAERDPNSPPARGLSRKDYANTAALVLGAGFLASMKPAASFAAATEPGDIQQILITQDGKLSRMGDHLGSKATVVVNVASYCALTGGSYVGLVDLYEKYHDKGLEILAFPCNQFGGQEPDPVSKIRKDVKARFGVNFPIFDKIDVNGKGMHPLYAALKSYEPELSGYGTKTAWNFEKWLLGPDGKPLRRYKPGVDPLEMSDDIEALLNGRTLPSARKRSLNDF